MILLGRFENVEHNASYNIVATDYPQSIKHKKPYVEKGLDIQAIISPVGYFQELGNAKFSILRGINWDSRANLTIVLALVSTNHRSLNNTLSGSTYGISMF